MGCEGLPLWLSTPASETIKNRLLASGLQLHGFITETLSLGEHMREPSLSLCKLRLRPLKDGNGEIRILERRGWMSAHPVPAETSCSQGHFSLSPNTSALSPLMISCTCSSSNPLCGVLGPRAKEMPHPADIPPLTRSCPEEPDPSGSDPWLSYSPSEWGFFFSTHLGPALGTFLNPCICHGNCLWGYSLFLGDTLSLWTEKQSVYPEMRMKHNKLTLLQ